MQMMRQLLSSLTSTGQWPGAAHPLDVTRYVLTGTGWPGCGLGYQGITLIRGQVINDH